MPEMKKYSEWGMASRSLILLLACSAIPSSGVTAETTPGNLPLNLLPWPKSVNVESGEVRIGSESRILVASPERRPLANILGEELRLLSGLNLKVSDGSSHDGDIVLKINNQLKAGDDILMVQKLEIVSTREGAHRLEAKKFVTVAGFDYRAVAEGTATLLQSISCRGNVAVVPAMTINDWPHADNDRSVELSGSSLVCVVHVLRQWQRA